MSDTDLTRALREAGHDDIAAQLERKQLGDQLRQAGRQDLATQLESRQVPPRPRTQLDAVAEALRRDVGVDITGTPQYEQANGELLRAQGK